MTVITLVHGSDLHFGRPHDAGAAEAFLEATKGLAPDLVVLSGDFTQRAKVAEFEEARAWLDRLAPLPVVVTPGNHDVPSTGCSERLFDPFRNYRAHVSEELDTVTRIPGATVVALNTAAPHRAIVNGRLRSHQLDFAAQAFRSGGGGPPGRGGPPPPGPGSGLRGRLTPFREPGESSTPSRPWGWTWSSGATSTGPGSGTPSTSTPVPTGAAGIVIVQSGTTTSHRGRAREREKNSFNVIRVGSEDLPRHPLDALRATRFHPFSEHRFPRRPRLWLGGGASPSAGPL
jgi:hypothetical protein